MNENEYEEEVALGSPVNREIRCDRDVEDRFHPSDFSVPSYLEAEHLTLLI